MGVKTMFETPEVLNPFPGLRPFEIEENNLFFGRDPQSDELLERLRRTRFLAVVGTSGSGKSSLIRAGVLPALYGGLMGSAGSSWRIAIFRPGHDPIGNLAAALGDEGVFGSSQRDQRIQNMLLETTLRRSSLGLVEAAQQARMSAHENLLIVVDQFEELFRFKEARKETASEDDAAAFVKLLLEAGTQVDVPLYVVLTMRSDFLGDCSQFAGLPEAINQGQYFIPRMSRDERRAAITGPIAVGGGEITLPLVSRLLNDVGDNPDQLPILQHALMRTWNYWAAHRRNGRPIGLEDYEKIGGMAEALSLHADEAWAELPTERSRQVAERLFKELTEKGADNRETRRPSQLSEICGAAEATEDEVVAVIEVFRREGRSFLMPPVGSELSSDTVIDISHESLIRNWDRLQTWVDEEAQSARIYRRLAEAAVLYRDGKEGLLIDPVLQIDLDWRDQNRPNAAWANRYHPEFETAIQFLEASREHRDAELAAARAREQRELEQTRDFAEKQARAARRLRWLAAGMAVMFLLALGTAGYAMIARKQAKDSEKTAKTAQAAAEEASTALKSLASSLKATADRLQQERDKAAGLALSLLAEQKRTLAEQERTKAALAKEQQAFRLQRQATARANEQKRIAVANAEKFEAALGRNELIRDALEAFRREEYATALTKFENLRKELEPLQPNVPRADNQEARRFVIDLSWTNSNIGTTNLRKTPPENPAKPEDVVDPFQKALSGLKPLIDKGDPITKDRLMFDTYYGLGHAYQRTGDNAEAEKFLQRALEFQQARAAEKRKEIEPKLAAANESDRASLLEEIRKSEEEIAFGFRDLARLYRDINTKEAAAEQNFILTAEHLRQDSNRDKIVAALRELGEFYIEHQRFDQAERSYNQLIEIQDKNATFEDAPKLADTYIELAQVYGGQKDEAKAARAFKLASLLQQGALLYRKNSAAPSATSEGELTYQLDQIGDAYIQLGRLPQAEETYKYASDIRIESTLKPGEAWRSYERLGNMFYSQIKDKEYAQHINEKEYADAYAKAKDYYFMLVSFFEPPPTEDVLKGKYAEGLERLARLYSNDPSTYEAAETKLTNALGIRRQRADWKGEFSTLSALVDLFRRENKQPKIDETYQTWLASMSKYIKQYNRPNPVPSVWSGFLSAYVRTVAEMGESYLSRKMNAQAEAVYAQAFAYSPLIRGRSYDAKVLEMYANSLEKYEALLRELNKPVEAAKVKPDIESVRNKLESERSRQLQQQTQGGPVQQSKEPQ
jgi:tetratricopeptide (TPR) repeat protein